MLSLIAASAFAFFAETHDPTFRSPADISFTLGEVLLGYIPRQKRISVSLLRILRSIIRIGILFIAACILTECLGSWAGVKPDNQILVSAQFFTDRLVELFVKPPASGLLLYQY